MLQHSPRTCSVQGVFPSSNPEADVDPATAWAALAYVIDYARFRREQMDRELADECGTVRATPTTTSN
jgi:hypothetical protein